MNNRLAPAPRMTGAYVFDLDTEAFRLLESFDHLYETTAIASADDPDNMIYGAALEDKWKQAPEIAEQFSLQMGGVSEEALENETSFSFATNTGMNGIIFNPQPNPFVRIMAPEIQQLYISHTLRHEAGHILVPGAQEREDGDQNITERAADSFADILLLKTRHPRAHDVLDFLSTYRAVELIHMQETSHFTLPVNDTIIAYSARIDFADYSNRQVIPAAKRFAEKFGASEKETRRVLDTFRDFEGFMHEDDLAATFHELALTTLRTPHRLSFHTGARALQPFLEPVSDKDLGFTFTAAPDYPRLRAAFQKRAADFGLAHIFSNFEGRAIFSSARRETARSAPGRPPGPR